MAPYSLIEHSKNYEELVGKNIDEFKITKFIGAGGMGVVFLALDTDLNREVVIKFLKEEYSNNDHFKDRFKIESQNIAKLNHFNIVNIYKIGKYNTTLYIVMEYIEGCTLSDLIQSYPINWSDAIEIVNCINNSIIYAHIKGIIHRDIKPANILITNKNIIKVVDFGLSKNLIELSSNENIKISSETDLIGTPLYIAPELWESGHNLSEKCDVYSLGVLFYEILTQHHPYEGKTTSDLYRNILLGQFKKPSFYNKNIPMELDDLISKMIDTNPITRHCCMQVEKDIKHIQDMYSLENSKFNIKYQLLQDARINIPDKNIKKFDKEDSVVLEDIKYVYGKFEKRLIIIITAFFFFILILFGIEFLIKYNLI